MSRKSGGASSSSTRRFAVLDHIPGTLYASTSHQDNRLRDVASHRCRTKLLARREAKNCRTTRTVIDSILSHTPIKDNSTNNSSPSPSSTTASKSDSPRGLVNSFYSVDVISPGTFLFSGPSLRSMGPSSHSNDQSQRRTPLTEIDSDSSSLRRAHTDSISGDHSSLLDASVMEPYHEQGITRTMSDVLQGMATPVLRDVCPPADKTHRQKAIASRYNSRRWPPETSTSKVSYALSLASLHLDLVSWKSLRLTCKSVNSAVTSTASSRFPAVYHMPVELLQEIYQGLGPCDFNNARHTCRAWFDASLDKALLVSMLRRGGWWEPAEKELNRRHLPGIAEQETPPISDEWFLSGLLSRECSLSSPGHMQEVAETDFGGLANGYAGPSYQHGAGLVFSTSICGRRLLVARETLIFVYELRGSVMQPITTIICPRRVLGMSMDISTGTQAVAALLEGRMGMVCKLKCGKNSTAVTARNVQDADGIGHPATRQHDGASFDSINMQANFDTITLEGTDDPSLHDHNWNNHTWNLHLKPCPASSRLVSPSITSTRRTGTIPIERGTSTFYRHLCSEDDPPRSVALCPQRRCVAFGCSAGVEVHWIDALSGQSLTRWFPLTAPSDYLYFLTPRPGLDSAKKLRLISSVARPDQRAAIVRKFVSSTCPNPSVFWGACGFETGAGRTSTCDHYRALPLSDGHHILFIDPPTGKLYLGCDAPLGLPTKILRKVFLSSPKPDAVPELYAAAEDMRWGARIVVVFNGTIMLYSIPADILAQSRSDQSTENGDLDDAQTFSTDNLMHDHWLNWWDDVFASVRREQSVVWPIAVRGLEIGTMSSVCEIGVLTSPDQEELTIWAFGHDLVAKTWQVRSVHGSAVISQRYICESGLVHTRATPREGLDALRGEEGDHYHADATREDVEKIGRPPKFIGLTLDGSSSLPALEVRCPKGLHVDNDRSVEEIGVVLGAEEGWYTAEGDVLVEVGKSM